MLTPYDFLAITGLKLGSERIEGNDYISLVVKCVLDVAIFQYWQMWDYGN